jgi:mannose-6-phosphate isomerase-like protein (cupin superfamily)
MHLFAESVHLESAFAAITDYWSPKVVAQVNDQYVKLAKIQGEFTWHSHEHEDELFFIVRGRLDMHYEGGKVVALEEGMLHVVPRATRHKPVAQQECWIMLIETVTTRHTGDVETPYTKTLEQQLA